MDLFEIRKKLSMGVPLYKIKLRVTNYSRVSTDHLEQKKSLVNQKEHFDEMIKNNYNWTYIEGYVDEGISGTSDKKRKNFRRMIRDARAGKFDLIITKEISRFSRNTLDSIKYTRELLDYGVAVYFVNDNINTLLPDSELRLTIMASLAQDEVRRLSERVKFGMNRSIKNEIILGNNSLLGYVKDKETGCLIVNQEEAELVKMIFKMYVEERLSLNKIANILNKRISNRRWRAIGIERIITNPKYKGYFCGKKTEVVDYITKKVKIIPKNEWIIYKRSGKIPVIIDETLWELANKRLKERKKTHCNKMSCQNKYLLTGKIICQNDGFLFHRRRHCKTNNDITWLCSNYLKNGKKECISPNIRESELLKIFEKIISCLEMENAIKILKQVYIKFYIKHDLYLKKMISKKNDLDIKIRNLINLYLEGNINKDEYLDLRKKYLLELNKAQVNDQINDYKKIENTLNKFLDNKEIKNKIIERILKKIFVWINKNDIYLKIILDLDDDKIKIIKKLVEDEEFVFKRGYETTKTKRYLVKYKIILDNNDT